MENEDRPTGRTPTERRSANRYMLEGAIGMVVFLFTFLFLPGLVPTEPGSAAALVFAVLPILPIAWTAIAVARFMRRLDELQRTIVSRSFAPAFLVAMLIAVTVGLLGGSGIDTKNSEWAIFVGGMVTWGIALAINSYRADR